MRWGGFAENVAPRLMELYEATPVGKTDRTILDVCCGTGQLALHFLNAGYTVVGLDSSEPMLHYARQNTWSFVEAGKARFIQGDAGRFTLDGSFGLAAATFDALNHLENEQQLKGCFASIFPLLVVGGLFVFDLNTAVGLRRWNNISIDDSTEEVQVISRAYYDEEERRGWARLTGFLRRPDGLYESFDEKVFNTVFDLSRVQNMLYETGWQTIRFARIEDLKTPLAEPENEGRVFIVAGK
jgi:SAM-dependent methyltransferase